MYLFLRTARLRNRLKQIMYSFLNRKRQVFNSLHFRINTRLILSVAIPIRIV